MDFETFETKRRSIENKLENALLKCTGISLVAELYSRGGEICMVRNGVVLFGHKINFYYRKDRVIEKEETLRFNMGTMGSFETKDSVTSMYIALGKILESKTMLKTIVDAVLKTRGLEKQYNEELA